MHACKPYIYISGLSETFTIPNNTTCATEKINVHEKYEVHVGWGEGGVARGLWLVDARGKLKLLK